VDSITSHLGISLTNALGVVVSASVLYVAVAAVLRHWGRRMATTASTGTIALVTLVGAIAARATLGNAPTLAGGLVAIGTLVVLERVFGRWMPAVRQFGRRRRPGRRPGPAAVVLMVGGEPCEDELRRAGITEHALWGLLRQSGVVHRDEVGVAVLEPRGGLSVMRAGQRFDRQLLVGVRGANEIPESFFADS
jgi:uncharacterized membrane protein YcaP (DUF421 family)